MLGGCRLARAHVALRRLSTPAARDTGRAERSLPGRGAAVDARRVRAGSSAIGEARAFAGVFRDLDARTQAGLAELGYSLRSL